MLGPTIPRLPIYPDTSKKNTLFGNLTILRGENNGFPQKRQGLLKRQKRRKKEEDDEGCM
jgi:hypothetical protein